MGETTAISWTDSTWNPFRARHRKSGTVGWQCELVSPGCANCYAWRWNRFRGTHVDYNGAGADQVEIYLSEKALRWPLTGGRTKPGGGSGPKGERLVFVCSMTDLFYERHTNEQIDQIFGVMAAAQNITFQVLTKRPQRALEYLARNNRQAEVEGARRAALAAVGIYPAGWGDGNVWSRWPLPNIWLGVSVEDQQRASERIPLLLKAPAAVRWLSVEPLLGRVDLVPYMVPAYRAHLGSKLDDEAVQALNALARCVVEERGQRFVDWVVVGGESDQKKKARPCDVGWIRSVRDQCRRANVPVWVKQLGSNPFTSLGPFNLEHPKGEEPSEWPEDLRIREFPS